MSITRKEFLKKAAVLSGGMVLIPALGKFYGCSAGAESIMVSASPDGVIKYNIGSRLKNTGEGVLLEVEKSDSKILLIKKSRDSFSAFDPTCTHKGCEIIKRRDFMECPCHGSEFDLDGNVIKGPAQIPLSNFRSEYDGKNSVTIFLK
jgi:cytochrome b6-f complex iron-sulfur subunit